ncbi:hypothetical protein LTR97_005857 [Elasticomyces elasticus]|uniref:Uncharacterized protein n=1 Tax=Elasticomyces elasticus TaxID=574655 RepID=A0AAN8A276_9PEZI|nr:hypothetical protein LTR97_005857 [Elasticomyces elasticus]
MAPTFTKRIHAALGDLIKKQSKIESHLEQYEKQLRRAKNAFEAACHVPPEGDSGEHTVREKARAYKTAQNDSAGAQVDLKAIEWRKKRLGYRLIDCDEEHPELEELLRPYVSVTAPVPGATPTHALKTSEIEEIARLYKVPGRIPAINPVTLEPSKVGLPGQGFVLTGARIYTYLPWCSTIVLNVDDKWVELRCPACKGNTDLDTGKLMLGISGMHDHLTMDHEYQPLLAPQIITLCKVREVSFSAVNNISKFKEARMPYIEMVTAQSNTSGAETASASTSLQDTSNDINKISWAWGSRPENVIKSVPCIVRHPDGRWFVLECPVCHGNASSRGTHGFFNGPKAFYDHLLQGHHKSRSIVNSLVGTIELCQVRELTLSEVDSLQHSKPNAIVIPVAQVTNTSRIPLRAQNSAELLEAAIDEAPGPRGVAESLVGGVKCKASVAGSRTINHGSSITPSTATDSEPGIALTASAQHHAIPQGRFAHSTKAFLPSRTSVAPSLSDGISHPRIAESDSRAGHDDESTARSTKKRRVDTVGMGDMGHADEDREDLGGAESVRRARTTNEPAIGLATDRKDGTFHNAQVISDGEESELLSDAESAHSADNVGHSVGRDPSDRKSASPDLFVSKDKVDNDKEGEEEEEGEEDVGGAVLPQQAVLTGRHSCMYNDSSDEE